MHLVNFPKVRIKKHEKGFVVESEISNWFGRKRWKHIISVSGMHDEPWYYSTYALALSEAQKLFRWDVIMYSDTTNL